MRLAIAAGLVISAASSSDAAVSRPRSALERDFESYAVAACFAQQSEPLLKEQGDAWAAAIVQRSAGDIEQFTALAKAVDAALVRKPSAIGHDEATGKGKPLPLLLCGEIVDAPPVRAAITRAEARLASAYRRPRSKW